MRLSAGVVLRVLSKDYEVRTNISYDADVEIDGFQLYEEGERPVDGVLYVVDGPINGGAWWNNKVQIGFWQEEPEVRKKCYYIALVETFDKGKKNDKDRLFSLINRIQQVFYSFMEFSEQAGELSKPDSNNKVLFGNITSLLNLIENRYGIIAILVDKNFRYLSMSEHFREKNTWVGDSDTMAVELINELTDDEYFMDAINHNAPFWYFNGEVDRNAFSACYNLKFNGVYEARLLLMGPGIDKFYGGLFLARYVGEMLRKALELNFMKDESDSQEMMILEFYELMNDLIDGRPRRTKDIENVLKVFGWRQNHSFQIYQISFMKEENETVTRRYYQTQIEKLISNSKVIIKNDKLCCIRNITLAEDDPDVLRQRISVFLRENLCKMGASQTFEGISNLPYAFHEAESALKIGSEVYETSWVYVFDDIILPYMRQQATKDLRQEHLYHPAVRKLIEYDTSNHKEMLRTVYEYMKNKYNVTATAEALFIHRTSLLFRLERIETITGIKWNDFKERLHLMISVMLYYEERG